MSAYSSEAYDFDMFEDHSAAEPLREDNKGKREKLKKAFPELKGSVFGSSDKF